MHIGLFSPGWPVNEYPSGIVTYVHQLRRELISQGHRVSVFTGILGRTNTDAGIYQVEVRLAYKIRSRLYNFFTKNSYDLFNRGKAIGETIKNMCRKDPIDILEMEESFGWFWDVSQRIPCPVVVKLHGPAFLTLVEEVRQTEMAAQKIRIEGEALREMAAIVSPSNFTLSSAVEYYGLSPRLMRVLPNLLEFDDSAQKWNAAECDRKTILFIGRFDKLKGGDIVLLAFRQLLDIDSQLKLVFVGPDWGLTAPNRGPIFFEEFSKAHFPNSLRGRIDFRGHVPREQLGKLRSGAMVTLVLSRWENQSYTALEAMSQGCPVVVSDVGGHREMVEDGVTGFVARSGDIEDICHKIMMMVSDPVRAQQLGENARRWVAIHHSPRNLVDRNLDFYREVITMAETGKS